MSLLSWLTMGDVVRTHLKTQQRTFGAVLEKAGGLSESTIRHIMFSGYAGGLPNAISAWLSNNIGESTRYWCKVNKKTNKYGYCDWKIPNKIVDLVKLKEWVYDKTDEEPKVEIDTEISTRTVLGMYLLYPNMIQNFAMTVSKGILVQKNPSMQSRCVRVFWMLLRRLSVQESQKDPTELTKSELDENISTGCIGSYLAGFYARFSIDKTSFWVRPFRVVAKNRQDDGLRVEWNKDFLETMNLEISSVDVDEVDGVSWKDYI